MTSLHPSQRALRLLWRAAGLVLFVCAGCAGASPETTPERAEARAAEDPRASAVETVQDAPMRDFFAGTGLGRLEVPGDVRDAPPRPLEVEVLEVQVELVGRMARTQVTQVFRNHLPRETEGTYSLTLPEGASIDRLAMDVEGVMVEGELVERAKARQVYESIVQRKKDPALMEWQGDNRFKTQLFPIPAGGTKTVVLAYAQLLPVDAEGSGVYRYTLPRWDATRGPRRVTFQARAEGVAGLDALGAPLQIAAGDGAFTARLDDAARLREGGVVELRARGVARADAAPLWARRGQETFFGLDVRLSPDAALASAPPRGVVFAVDTSAGLGQPVLEQAKAVVRGAAATLGDGARLQVVHGDIDARACWAQATPAGEATPRALGACLDPLDAGGGTDLGALLARAAEEAKALGAGAVVVLLSDGVASLGQLTGAGLEQRWAQAVAGADVRLNTVALGHSANEDGLRALAWGGHGHALRLTPDASGRDGAEALARVWSTPTLNDVRARVVEGAVEGLTPHAPRSLPQGHALMLLGRLDSPRAVVELTGTTRRGPFKRAFTLTAPKQPPTAPDALLPRFWARATLADMDAAGVPRREVVAVSLRYGVMSRYTSFLVLENDAAYKRFQIARRKDAERRAAEAAPEAARNVRMRGMEDLNTPVVPSGGEAFDAKQQAPAEVAMSGASDALGIGLGAGGMGLRGKGSGGGGEGFGRVHGLGRVDTGGGKGASARLGKKRAAPKPLLRLGASTVQGGLDKAPIQRVIRQHSARLRYCYERALTRDPSLAGRVAVRFAIQPNGDVASVTIQDATLRDAEVQRCVLASVKRMRFPSPRGGGLVMVTYPFVFGQHDAPEPPRDRLARLLAQRAPLSPGDLGEVVRLRLALGERAKAEEALLDGIKRHRKAPEALVTLWASPQVREAFAARWLPLAEELVRGGALSASRWLDLTTDAYAAQGQTAQARALAQTLRLSPDEAQHIVRRVALLDLDMSSAQAEALLEAWRAAGAWAPEAMWPVLVACGEPCDTSRAYRIAQGVEAAKAHFMSGDAATRASGDSVLSRLANEGPLTSPAPALAALAEQRCLAPEVPFGRCAAWLQALADAHPSARALLGSLAERRLKEVAAQRRDNIADAGLIAQHADLLTRLKRDRAARRVLSEVVEFAPHDLAARFTYAQALQRAEGPEAACAQYAQAAQVEPANREAFRRMRALTTPDNHAAIAACALEGVAALPVARDVSVVVAWDDPQADIDLHVHEPANQHVFYSQSASSNGGLLYFDITNGFGPEVYVLGAAPKGLYRVGLVYYSGSADTVNATVTVIRDAGAPNASRQTFPVVLRRSAGQDEVQVTTLRL